MSDNYEAIYADFWQWRLTESPYYAALCGDASQKGRLNSWSLKSAERRVQYGRELINRLDNLKQAASLDEKTTLDIDLLLHELRTFVGGHDAQAHYFPMGVFDNPVSAVDRMLRNFKFDVPQDFDDALAVMKAVPNALEEVVEVFREAIEKRMTFHSSTLEAMKANLKKAEGTETEKFTWIITLKERLKATADRREDNNNESEVNKEKAEVFMKSVKALIDSDVRPSIGRLIEFLEKEYSPHTRPNISMASLPVVDGMSDLYSHALRFHIDLPMTPKEVHDLGWQEMERIEAEMRVIRNS